MMKSGYNIFQVDLWKPGLETREDFALPVAWTVGGGEAELVCDWLNEKYRILYFFITKK